MDGQNPTLAPYAKEGECYMRVTAKAHTAEEADTLCQPLIEEIKRRVGDFVYSVDTESLEELVVSELKAQGKTLATAESCTGGLLSKRLTDVSGASEVFHMAASPTPTRPRRTCSLFPTRPWPSTALSASRQPGRWPRASCAALAAAWAWASRALRAPRAATAEKPVG